MRTANPSLAGRISVKLPVTLGIALAAAAVGAVAAIGTIGDAPAPAGASPANSVLSDVTPHSAHNTLPDGAGGQQGGTG
jgi:hypothetical protein